MRPFRTKLFSRHSAKSAPVHDVYQIFVADIRFSVCFTKALRNSDTVAHAFRVAPGGIATSSFFALQSLGAMLCSQVQKAEHPFVASLASLGRTSAANYKIRLVLATFAASGGRDAEGPA